jgi:Leucine-rich repeat (LRR) protein
MKSLVTLDLSWNKIRELPDSIGNIKTMKSFNVAGNKLLMLPDTLGQEQVLTFLDISNNKLTAIPNDLRKLRNLETFNLNAVNVFGKFSSVRPLLATSSERS